MFTLKIKNERELRVLVRLLDGIALKRDDADVRADLLERVEGLIDANLEALERIDDAEAGR